MLIRLMLKRHSTKFGLNPARGVIRSPERGCAPAFRLFDKILIKEILMLSLLLLVASADTSALTLSTHAALAAVAAQGAAAPKEKKDSEKKDTEKKDSEKKDTEKKKEDAPSGFGNEETEDAYIARAPRQGGFFTSNPVGRVIAAPVVVPAKIIGRVLGIKPKDGGPGTALCRK